jgi:hypothetical protein
MQMTKREVKAALGIKTDAALGRFFNIGRGAIGLWKDDEPIPGPRQWELRARRPDLFSAEQKAA